MTRKTTKQNKSKFHRKNNQRRSNKHPSILGNKASQQQLSGTLRVNPRGFGFVTPTMPSLPQENYFIPEKLLVNLFDGDLVSIQLRGGSTQNIKLLTRTRKEFIGSVLASGKKVQMDPGVGSGIFDLPEFYTPADALRFNLDGDIVTNIRSLGPDTSDLALYERFMERHLLPIDDTLLVMPLNTNTTQTSKPRSDLTSQLTITIDDDSSIDLDDALAATLLPDGSIIVWVHIADVAEKINAGDPLDVASRSTPTSIYMPQKVRHMLPVDFTRDHLSLLPGTLRNTLCVEMKITLDGDISNLDIFESKVRTSSRLSYDTVGRIISNLDTSVDTPTLELVRILRSASVRLGVERTARGGLEAFRQEDGNRDAPRDLAHAIIERLMVAANEQVATWAHARSIPTLRRAHNPISDKDAAMLESTALGFGVISPLGRPASTKALAYMTEQIPSVQAQSFWATLTKILGRAYYCVDDSAHFALGSSAYLHFTSPIRRYPDLLVHRMLKAYLHGTRDFTSQLATLNEAAAIANDVSTRASFAEKEAYLARNLSNLKQDMELFGTIISYSDGSVKVRLDDNGLVGSGNFAGSVGTRIKVGIKHCDMFAGTLTFTQLTPSKLDAKKPLLATKPPPQRRKPN
jgi:ribonuclease R